MTVASSRSGGLRVRANEQGTPLEITIEPSELRRPPDTLAREIVQLCRDAARTAGLARRAELRRAGVGSAVLRYMGLPEPGDEDRTGSSAGTDERPVESWLRG